MEEKKRTISQTPAPKKDRVYGSKVNKSDSSKDTNSAKSIKFNDSTLQKIENKVAEHNKKHPNKKISLSSAKAVVRRGMGAYSSSHRPTIKGGKPNSRVAWGLARLNAFLYKIVNGKSKSGKYSQDNDLINELGYKVAKYNEGGLIAPNGKPSNLTPKQYKLVRSESFKAWFGDWENDPTNASKVVDSNGEPLVVYHGTDKTFNVFRGTSIFFVADKHIANLYAKYIKNGHQRTQENENPIVYDCFLNIRSMLVEKIYGSLPNKQDELTELFYLAEDGILLKDTDDFGGVYDQYIVFNSNQIKLADGTNTTFDGNNPDIRFDGGGNVNTNSFEKWFNKSKVVDKKGNPLIVYHGSPDLRGLKEKYIFESRFADNQSFFFTDNYSMAKSYADPQRAFDYQNAEEGVIGLYLSLQNPLIVNAFNQIWRKFETIIDGNEIIGTRNLIKFAKDKGYDGVIVENVRDYYNNNENKTKGGNVYVAFEPNQIKLADGSNTTFDSNNPDIRFMAGGIIKKPNNIAYNLQSQIDSVKNDIIDKADISNEIKAKLKKVRAYVVQSARGVASYTRGFFSVPLWAYEKQFLSDTEFKYKYKNWSKEWFEKNKARDGYFIYYVAHELAHWLCYFTDGAEICKAHNKNFYDAFKKICPYEYQHYELAYIKSSTKFGIPTYDQCKKIPAEEQTPQTEHCGINENDNKMTEKQKTKQLIDDLNLTLEFLSKEEQASTKKLISDLTMAMEFMDDESSDAVELVKEEPKYAYLMTLDEYVNSGIIELITEYEKFIRKNQDYLAKYGYGKSINRYTLPEALELGKSSPFYSEKDIMGRAITNVEKKIRRDFAYSITREFDDKFDIDTPVDVVNKNREYRAKLLQHFTEKELTDFEPDYKKTNKRVVKSSMDNKTYFKLIKDGKLQISRLEDITESVGVRITKETYSADKGAELKEYLKKTKIPQQSYEQIVKFGNQIREDLEPTITEVHEQEFYRYKNLITENLGKSFYQEELNPIIPMWIRVYDVDTTYVSSGRYKITLKSLSSNWEEKLDLEVDREMEILFFNIIKAMINAFDFVKIPLESFERLKIEEGKAGFQGEYKFNFVDGSSFVVVTKGIGAGGYNIQKYHFRYLTNLTDMTLPDGSSTKDNSHWLEYKEVKRFEGGELKPRKTPFGDVIFEDAWLITRDEYNKQNLIMHLPKGAKPDKESIKLQEYYSQITNRQHAGKVQDAIENGLYAQAIRNGQMTKERANEIIESAELKKRFNNGGNVNDNKFNEGGLIAPNGKPSNLTPQQYKLVRSESFKAWFGDWENDPANASKVVDENGEPLVCYHTSNKKFTKFNYKLSYDGAIWFTENIQDIINNETGAGKTGVVYEVFLDIKKMGDWDDYDKGIAELLRDKFNGAKMDDDYIVFEPNQIKLADGSNTTFDSNNPDIRFMAGGNINDNKMSNTEKLIQEIKKHSNHTISEVMTNADGEKYRFHHWKLKYPSASNWLVQLFMKASKENTGKDYNKNFSYGDISFYYDRPEMKGRPNGSMQMRELEVLKNKFNEGGRTLTRQEIESMQRIINDPLVSPKLKESFKKVLDSRKVPENADFSRFPEGKYIDPYDFSGYEYMKSRNEEMGVSFLLTGEYELVSKAIFERDYAMWLFYNYLGRVNISFANCQLWIKEAQASFINEMPIQVGLTHQPKAKDGRSYAMWYTCGESQKVISESRLGVKLTFEYNGRWYCNEIGMVGNYDYKGTGWGTYYEEKKTGLLVPEYTETSFHLNTLIHEFAHCFDFQSQLLANIEKYKNKKFEKENKEVDVNTEEMTELEKQLYGASLKDEPLSVSNPITNHFDYFIDSLIKVLRQCASGKIPLTQKFEQQALDVQTALEGTYGDLLLAQREKRKKDAIATKKMDEMRENTRFTWQGKIISEFMKYVEKYAIQREILESLSKRGVQRNFTLSEIIELDNLISQYAKNEFLVFASKNPSKSQALYNELKDLKVETNRIINNHYDNIRRDYEYGFIPNTDLDKYLQANCNVRDFRDYKSWKECNQSKLSEKMR